MTARPGERHDGPRPPGPVPPGVAAVLEVVRGALGGAVAGVYLFGSAVAGGLRPRSDLDFLVVVEGSVPEGARRALVAGLARVSGRWPGDGSARPVEVTVVRLEDVVPWRYPPWRHLVYGEWLRAELEAGRIAPPAPDPDLAIVLASVLRGGLALVGPEPAALLDPVPPADLRRAIRDSLGALTRSTGGDERNVLLTLARMWTTLETGEIVPKDVAAARLLERLPPERRAVLDLARRAYLGECADAWAHRADEVEAFVRHLERELLRARDPSQPEPRPGA